ncbi:DNA damage tolerance protein rad31 [Verticillium alfalfae VaMs.102]|uniref:Ubiquitin-like 1-activating enzyme E1A n=1 Tax=Verticillium alfalfae (strain VaMs.102 / ATCC MYA-4576 / FGSC 10136) TaxID=526221 RepID=C9SV20_VERA1|nr:DNA damage tolerance protein rad31 [Verticillium alfalfae VaMs.102]EEY22635.1 DNA damage tolerance protein rad31 [Verticillium alfalfae VaMs.102]
MNPSADMNNNPPQDLPVDLSQNFHAAAMDQVLPEALQEVAPGAIPEILPGMLPTGEMFMPQLVQTQQHFGPSQHLFQANGVIPPMPHNAISADEIALYDRQIRLWGMKAQEKIRGANILLITMKALANEVAKNLVLAGIGSLTICDGDVVTEADLGSQFFLAADHSLVGQNRAQAAAPAVQKMNPRVVVHADAERVQTKGSSYFSAFDIVIATDLDSFTLNIVNTATRLHNKAFYAAGCHGLYGFIFADLIEHDYVIQRELSNVATKLGSETRTRSVVDVQTKKEGGKTIESVTKRELYSTWYLASDVVASLPREYTQTPRRKRAVTPALSCLRALWEFQTLSGGRLPGHTKEDLGLFTKLATAQHAQLGLLSETLRSETLRSFLQSLGGEMAPVAAILGGQLAQDVINVLGQTQQPIQNTVVFDGNTMEANVYPLHPPGALGRGLLSESMPAALPNGGVALGDPGMMMPMSMDGMDFVGAAPVVTQ